jgi:hypothetical protein
MFMAWRKYSGGDAPDACFNEVRIQERVDAPSATERENAVLSTGLGFGQKGFPLRLDELHGSEEL